MRPGLKSSLLRTLLTEVLLHERIMLIQSLFLSLIPAIVWADCPRKEDSYPCHCEEENGRSTLHCNYLTEASQLKQGLSRLQNYQISALSIWMLTTNDTIEPDSFKGPSFLEINFSHSKLHLKPPQLIGHEKYLYKITFTSCFNEENTLEPLSLEHLKNLKEINFYKNQIRQLKSDFFESMPQSLKYITFDDCKIEELENNVFAKLNSLITLFITNNKIKKISRSMLPTTAEDLSAIALYGNNLENIPDDFFEDLPNLKSVSLERNNLRTLSESLWSPVFEKLSRVFLDENPFNCDEDMKWLTKTSLPKTLTGTCHTPAKLKSKYFKNLIPADFH